MSALPTPVSASPPPPPPAWIAHDPASRQLLEVALKVAATTSTVLIQGESGTGKDLLAQRLHFLGPCRHEPIVKIDCASLPAELLESELFGYEKGAFTGAYQAKPGRLELAGEGTLVLDEVAALTLPLQAKLLRVLEEKAFERLGGQQRIPIQARIVALTNTDLRQAVARRSFREDLYYRLYVLPLTVPPLRERPADIIPLAHYFLTLTGASADDLSAEAEAALSAYVFPGNVRELRSLLQRARIQRDSGALQLEDFPAQLASTSFTPAAAPRSLQQMEIEHIATMLQYCRGRKQMAARLLGISPKTLLEKRRKYGLDLPWTDRVPEAARKRH
ncbi:MAG: sigma 54-interacting transcriptional regulator [Terriglobales bacterium]